MAAFLHSSDTDRRRPELIQFVDAGVRRVEFDVTLKAGNSYRVKVTALRLDSRLPHVNYCSIGSGEAQFKAGLFQANDAAEVL